MDAKVFPLLLFLPLLPTNESIKALTCLLCSRVRVSVGLQIIFPSTSIRINIC